MLCPRVGYADKYKRPPEAASAGPEAGAEAALSLQILDVGWPELHAPPLDKVCTICKAQESWLHSDPQRVVVIHCRVGALPDTASGLWVARAPGLFWAEPLPLPLRWASEFRAKAPECAAGRFETHEGHGGSEAFHCVRFCFPFKGRALVGHGASASCHRVWPVTGGGGRALPLGSGVCAHTAGVRACCLQFRLPDSGHVVTTRPREQTHGALS